MREVSRREELLAIAPAVIILIFAPHPWCLPLTGAAAAAGAITLEYYPTLHARPDRTTQQRYGDYERAATACACSASAPNSPAADPPRAGPRFPCSASV